MSSYDEVIEKDLILLKSIQDYCYRTPWVNDYMARIVSKNPLRDIVSVLWLFFVYGLVELGPKHFWVVAMNLVGSFVLRSFIEAKRPVEYDIRMQPLTDKSATSYGFPSLESHLAVVIMGHLFLSFKSIALLPLGLVTVAIVGFSRVYSRARFPHQIFGSWLSGMIGLIVSMHCCERMSIHKMTHHQHGVCVIFVCVGVLCHLALSIENNDSRLVHLPREEFVKVMSGILSGGDKNTASVVEQTQADEGEGEGEEGAFYDPVDPAGLMSHPSTQRSSSRASTYRTAASDESPRTAATRQAQQHPYQSQQPTNGLTMGENNPQGAALGGAGGGGRQAKRVKSDSLYFLQRSLEQREKQYREGQVLTARTDDTEYEYPQYGSYTHYGGAEAHFM